MRRSRLPFAIVAACAASATLGTPAPSTFASQAPVGVEASRESAARQETGPPAPATQTVSASRQVFVPLVNVPQIVRSEPVWLGRPRDTAGRPMGGSRPY